MTTILGIADKEIYDSPESADRSCAPVTLFGDIPPRIVNADGSLRHIIEDGARWHVVWWDTAGAHCSEPECEINRRRVSPNAPGERLPGQPERKNNAKD